MLYYLFVTFMTMTATTTFSPDKSVTANLSLKLDTADRDRLRSLAEYKNRTPHFIMKEAIHKYLEEEEAQQRFVAAAKASRSHYKKTGLHVTHEEFSQWVDALQTNPNAVPPTSHV
jgi:predicted transcriptional regulator